VNEDGMCMWKKRLSIRKKRMVKKRKGGGCNSYHNACGEVIDVMVKVKKELNKHKKAGG